MRECVRPLLGGCDGVTTVPNPCLYSFSDCKFRHLSFHPSAWNGSSKGFFLPRGCSRPLFQVFFFFRFLKYFPDFVLHFHSFFEPPLRRHALRGDVYVRCWVDVMALRPFKTRACILFPTVNSVVFLSILLHGMGIPKSSFFLVDVLDRYFKFCFFPFRFLNFFRLVYLFGFLFSFSLFSGFPNTKNKPTNPSPLSFIAITAAIVIYRAAATTGAGLAVNVAQLDSNIGKRAMAIVGPEGY